MSKFVPAGFDPDDVLEVAPTARPQAPAGFAPEDVLEVAPTAAVAPAGFAPEDVLEVADAPTENEDKTSFFPAADNELLRDIAERHGVPEEDLRQWAGWLGGNRKDGGRLNDFAQGVNVIDESVFMGLGEKAATTVAGQLKGERYQAALDDLRQEMDARKSGLRKTAEFLGGFALPAVGIGRLGKAGKAAGDLVFGAAKEGGEELARRAGRGAIQGTVAGAGYGAVQGGVSNARGDDTLGERAYGAAVGGTTGAVFGSAAGGAGGAIFGGKFGQQLKESLGFPTATKPEAKSPETQKSAVRTEADPLAPNPLDADTSVRDQLKAAILKEANGASKEDVVAFLREQPAYANRTPKEVEQLFLKTRGEFNRFVKSRKIEKATGGKVKGSGKAAIRDARFQTDVSKLFDDFYEVRLGLSRDVGEAKLRAKNEGAEDTVKRVATSVMDGRYRMAQLDDRLRGFGIRSNLSVLADDLSAALNKVKVLSDPLMDDAVKLGKPISKTGLSEEDWTRLADEVDGQSLGAFIKSRPDLSPDQVTALRAQETFFDKGHEVDKAAGGRGERLGGVQGEGKLFYNPRMLKDLSEIPKAFQARFEQLKAQGIDLQAGTWDKLTPEALETIQGLEVVLGRKFKPELKHIVAQAAKDVYSTKSVGAGIVSQASSAKQRTGEIPFFLRETNPLKVASKWVHNTLSHTVADDTLRQIAHVRNLAKTKGDVDTVKQLDAYLADQLGTRNASVAEGIGRRMTQWSADLQRVMEDSSRAPMTRGAASFVLNSGRLMDWLGGHMYANLLGLNPKTHLDNLLQVPNMVVPEIGYVDSTKVIGKAYARYFKDLFTGKLNEKMAAWGDMPPASRLRRRAQLEQGIKEMGWTEKNIRRLGIGLDEASDFSMKVFEMTERMNRYLASEAAEEIARRMAKDPGSFQTLRKAMPPAYQELVQASLKDPAKLQEVVRRYLVSKSIFNYDRATMNEFGRYMGTAFTAFTKWPASIGGDVAYTMTRRDLKAGGKAAYLTRRFGGPTAIMMALNLAMFDDILGPEGADDDEERLAARKLLGGYGFLGSVPGMNIVSLLKEQSFGQTPGVTLVKDALSGDVKKAAANFGTAFLPLMQYLRFVDSDIPAIFGTDPVFVEGEGKDVLKHPVRRVLKQWTEEE